MSDVAIRVENLTKKFYLGERIGIKTFREALQEFFASPFRVWKRNGPDANGKKVDTAREIWALKGVSFEVKHGEVLGIIGPNGAGKSTLLKILSRITEPTGGYAEIRGRVGSLLEVGTGFHPELTGRENVYLNGAILGMSKAEIRRKFDDIVSFAGVEKFIDTPVKRYSSGMQVRLAFAVAAHLDPEILIIDEVLAVGDAEFQKRCLGKMNEVSRSGRTILFVSHNMAAVEGLCTRAIFLVAGKQVAVGTPLNIIRRYLLRHHEPTHPASQNHLCPYAVEVCVGDFTGSAIASFLMGDDIPFHIKFAGLPPGSAVSVSIRICNGVGQRILTCNNIYQCPKPIVVSGDAKITLIIKNCRLMPDIYSVHAIVGIGGLDHWRIEFPQLRIIARDLYNTGRIPSTASGVWAPETEWRWTPCGR